MIMHWWCFKNWIAFLLFLVWWRKKKVAHKKWIRDFVIQKEPLFLHPSLILSVWRVSPACSSLRTPRCFLSVSLGAFPEHSVGGRWPVLPSRTLAALSSGLLCTARPWYVCGHLFMWLQRSSAGHATATITVSFLLFPTAKYCKTLVDTKECWERWKPISIFQLPAYLKPICWAHSLPGGRIASAWPRKLTKPPPPSWHSSVVLVQEFEPTFIQEEKEFSF